MLICLATQVATWDCSAMLLNAAIAIGSLLIGWFVKVLADHMSEKRLCDHRIRLEKEYGLYSDLWDKLFELRRSVGQAVDSMSGTNEVRHDQEILDLFNAYQAVVRKGEPFMDVSVFTPAREIVRIAGRIISNIGKLESHTNHIATGTMRESDAEMPAKKGF